MAKRFGCLEKRLKRHYLKSGWQPRDKLPETSSGQAGQAGRRQRAVENLLIDSASCQLQAARLLSRSGGSVNGAAGFYFFLGRNQYHFSLSAAHQYHAFGTDTH